MNSLLDREEQEEQIDDFDAVIEKSHPTRLLWREATARSIAGHLLTTFRFTLWGALGAAVLIPGACIFMHYQPESTVSLVKDAFIPLVAGIGTFAATVFGPLLAFVLGYYFGKKD